MNKYRSAGDRGYRAEIIAFEFLSHTEQGSTSKSSQTI